MGQVDFFIIRRRSAPLLGWRCLVRGDPNYTHIMASCKQCSEPLVLLSDFEEDPSDAYEEIPDDVALSCGCHFHWCVYINSIERDKMAWLRIF